MRAYRRIYEAAGWWNEHWGRLKTIAFWLGAAAAVAGLVGGFLIHTYGVVGTVAIAVGASVLFVIVVSFVNERLLSRRRILGSEGVAVREEPTIAVYVPERSCERYPYVAGGECLYCHLAVEAISDQKLTRCHARLIRVEKAQNQQWVRDARFAAPMRLKWAFFGPDHPEVEYRDIQPDETALLDLVYTIEQEPNRTFIETLDVQPTGITRNLEPAVYLLTVRTIAEDHDPIDCTVILGVTGSWQSVTMSQFPGRTST